MNKPIERIRVSLKFSEEQQFDIGEIVSSNRSLFFKYHPDFLKKKFNISPFKLPLSPEIIDMSSFPFDGIAGVFNDSLPDGWGRLLLDRSLTAQGIPIHQITLLDRLAYVGDKGSGALCYDPVYKQAENIEDRLTLDQIATETEQLLEGTPTEILDDLFILGGSSGGARPKVNVLYNAHIDQIKYDAIDEEGFEHWIVKFASSIDWKDIAQIEFAYHLMALDAGIEMSECKLFYGESGKAYFGTKRFDRQQNQRLHMHSASGLMHDNFRLSNMDYGHLMDCAFQLERHVGAYEKILRLAAFNVYSHNRDDHSKNFAFLMNDQGNWQFAPAYDLTFSTSSHGFQSTLVAGESQKPGRKHLLELASHFGVKNPSEIIEQVRESISNWKNFAEKAGVSKSSQNKIQNVLNEMND